MSSGDELGLPGFSFGFRRLALARSRQESCTANEHKVVEKTSATPASRRWGKKVLRMEIGWKENANGQKKCYRRPDNFRSIPQIEYRDLESGFFCPYGGVLGHDTGCSLPFP